MRVQLYLLVAMGVTIGQGQASPEFLRAAMSGDRAAVDKLLKSGVDANWSDRSGVTAIMAAAAKGHVGVIEAIWRRGGDLNRATSQDRLSALMIASHYGLFKSVEMLLSLGADSKARDAAGRSALDWAATSHVEASTRSQIVQVLTANGAEPSKRDGLGLVIALGTKPNIDSLFTPIGSHPSDRPSKPPATPFGQLLLDACASNNFALAKAWLRRGADPDALGPTGRPLHMAAEAGNAEMIVVLLENGANVNAKDLQGHRPLDIAINSGKIDSVRALLRWKPDLSGTRADSIKSGRVEITKLLEAAGAR